MALFLRVDLNWTITRMMTIGKTRHPATTEPRGVLRAMIPGEISHQRQAPPPALACLVEHFWRVRWNFEGLPPKVVETLPHPNVHIVIEPGTSQVFGVHTGRWTRALEGRSTAFGIKFRPGAFRPLLRDAVSSLRDASLPIEAIFGSEAHELDAIADCRDDSKDDARAIELAAKFLLARVPSLDQSALLAGRMVDSVVDNREMHNAAALAKKFEMGLRAVQRLFHEYVGVGPKWVRALVGPYVTLPPMPMNSISVSLSP